MSSVTRYLDPALVERLNALSLSARSVVEGTTTGQHKSPIRGASIEFRAHRPYARGDELRRLDWRVLGRTDRPYVKEYDEETNLRAVLMLDCSGSMSYGGKSEIRNPKSEMTKFEYATKLVASLAYLMLGQTESVGLGVFRQDLEQWLTPRAGKGQLARVIEVLERLSPAGRADSGRAIQSAADRVGRRALIIVVSDFFAPVDVLREGLARLRHERHEVIVLRVLDRDEAEFPFGSWMRLRGLEGEPSRLCEPALVRRNYLRNFEAHREELDATCRKLGVEMHTFMTDKVLDVSLVSFLRHRSRITINK